MRLVLGGVAQGKRNYVKTAYHISENDIFSGENAELEQLCGAKAVDKFHLWVRRAGRCAKTHRNIYKEKPGLYRDLQ